MKGTLAERFLAKVDQRGPDDCWPWTGATNNHGYGIIRTGTSRAAGGYALAHRVALLLDGRDPTGALALYSCDTPACVNPAHLAVGSQGENMRQMVERRRGLVGELNGNAKLDPETVAAIRAHPGSSTEAAPLFGVTARAIRRIRHGDLWAHVA